MDNLTYVWIIIGLVVLLICVIMIVNQDVVIRAKRVARQYVKSGEIDDIKRVNRVLDILNTQNDNDSKYLFNKLVELRDRAG